MKNLVILLILGVIGFTGWQAISGVMKTSALQQILLDVLADAPKKSKFQMIQEIKDKAEREKINVIEDEIDIEISAGSSKGVPSNLVQKHGIQTSQIKYTIHATHTQAVLIWKKDFQTAASHMYTTKATLKTPNYEKILQGK